MLSDSIEASVENQWLQVSAFHIRRHFEVVYMGRSISIQEIGNSRLLHTTSQFNMCPYHLKYSNASQPEQTCSLAK